MYLCIIYIILLYYYIIVINIIIITIIMINNNINNENNINNQLFSCFTGAMGETMRGETDVSFANYFITSDRLRNIDMTIPYNIDYTCFITPKPKPLPQYSAVAWPFTVRKEKKN